MTFFQGQREQWVRRNQRTMVEGHSQLQCKACQGTQVIAKKIFQVELVDRTWKKKIIEAQVDNHQIFCIQNPFSGKV
jgi:hypothetical protein